MTAEVDWCGRVVDLVRQEGQVTQIVDASNILADRKKAQTCCYLFTAVRSGLLPCKLLCVFSTLATQRSAIPAVPSCTIFPPATVNFDP